MHQGRIVFSQLLDFLPRKSFRTCVNRYHGNYRIRSLTCYEQFLCMAFAQLTYRHSLRDTVLCLQAMENKLHHSGIQCNVAKSTLADANEKRNWRIYCDFAQVLIGKARKLYADDDFGLQLDETVYALDASTIDLCRSVFPWARFRSTKSGIKVHTLLDLKGNNPSFISITDAKVHDVNILDDLFPEPGSIYVMDRAYLDFARLHRLNRELAFFILRAKTNTQLHRLYSAPVDKSTGVICDQTVRPIVPQSANAYPEKLRRIKYHDLEAGKRPVCQIILNCDLNRISQEFSQLISTDLLEIYGFLKKVLAVLILIARWSNETTNYLRHTPGEGNGCSIL